MDLVANASQESLVEKVRALELRVQKLKGLILGLKRSRSRHLSRFCSERLTSVCSWRRTGDRSTRASALARPKTLGVFVVGMYERYYGQSTLQHVVGPAARSGFDVDYYMLLCRRSLPGGAFRATWFEPHGNPAMANLTVDALKERVVREARYYGAQSVFFALPETLTLDELPSVPRTPWRPRRRNDTTYVRNLLWLKGIELLWNESAVVRGHRAYDRVVLIRSDVFWVDTLHMFHFTDIATIYSRPFGSHYCQRGTDSAPEDKVFVIGGDVAELWLSRLYTDFNRNPSQALRVCEGTEHYMFSVAQHYGIRWKMVDAPLPTFPYFTALHLAAAGSQSKLVFCLRGGTRRSLLMPQVPCLDPAKVIHPFCEDLLPIR